MLTWLLLQTWSLTLPVSLFALLALTLYMSCQLWFLNILWHVLTIQILKPWPWLFWLSVIWIGLCFWTSIVDCGTGLVCSITVDQTFVLCVCLRRVRLGFQISVFVLVFNHVVSDSSPQKACGGRQQQMLFTLPDSDCLLRKSISPSYSPVLEPTFTWILIQDTVVYSKPVFITLSWQLSVTSCSNTLFPLCVLCCHLLVWRSVRSSLLRTHLSTFLHHLSISN